MFKITHKDKKSKARVGLLKTPNGTIETPSYVIVATHAKVKALKPNDLKKTKTQIVISNTYHLWEKALKKGASNIVFKNLGVKIPTMTDSGGFQVFSLGFGMENKVGKILNEKNEKIKDIKRKNIKITNKGVFFKIGGQKKFLGPKLSMEIQSKLGADIIFAFDECTSPLDGFKYNQEALIRTHKWAKESLEFRDPKQKLFGIIQGGLYKTLREKSAKFIGTLPFDGFGIGGSFGKDEMRTTLKWVMPHLPEEKPKHLLGIGKIEDIFNAIEEGVDLFDCVIPTREARHGRIWTKNGYFDIRKNANLKSKSVLEKNCLCPVCKNKTTRLEINKLFKNKNNKEKAERLASIHNVWFFNSLVEEIRSSIKNNCFKQFREKTLKNFKNN
jgi:queuine tRNA-ribosyltransferase